MSDILTLDTAALAALEGKRLQWRYRSDEGWFDAVPGKLWQLELLATREFRLRPTEQRNFAGALEWLREGKAIRRTNWADGEHWRINTLGFLFAPWCEGLDILVGKNNLFAADWEVAE